MKTFKTLFLTTLTLLFFVPAFAQLKVIADGKVGIATATPTQALEVNGWLKTNGQFILHGSGAGANEAGILTGFERTTAGSAAIRFYNNTGNFGSWGTTFGLDATGGGGLFHKGHSTLGIVTLNTSSVGLGTNNAYKFYIQGSDGFVGVNTITPGFQLEVNGDAAKPGGGTWTAVSDKRLKKDVHPFEDGLEEILKINPVFYKYNGAGGVLADGKEYVGVIAQEIQKVAPYTVSTFKHRVVNMEMKDGAFLPTETVVGEEEFLAVDGTAIQYMLINAIKEHQRMMDEKDAKITALEERLTRLERLLGSTGGTTAPAPGSINVQTVDLGSYLLQNQPNPFNQTTTIRYTLPKDASTASLRVTDMNGKLLKEVRLSTDTYGEVILNAGELGSGTYSYSLIVNGRTLETKQMVLTK